MIKEALGGMNCGPWLTLLSYLAIFDSSSELEFLGAGILHFFTEFTPGGKQMETSGPLRKEK